ncbi:MAG: hypothetical protein MKZ57_02220 [Candidatus Poseidoniaceae archaeon]|nr:hypothetical protein [Candidatus Poseidoniaceae archaeon]
MFVATIVLLAISIIPGYALCKVLDGTADKWRKAMLSPALGLLLIYGACGLVVLSGLSTWGLTSAVILLINTLAIAHIKRRINEERGLTQWQKLEAAMNGMILESEDQDITEEVATQQWFQSNRYMFGIIVGAVLCLGVLLLPLFQKLPFGVDWIGFAVLAGQIAENGNMILNGVNEGSWTYPPAFPALAGWLASSLGISSGKAVFLLGHYTLAVLIIGAAGAMDHHGAGGQFFVTMALGFGLFAKAYDSGYPTVASQLGLVVGLLVLLRPSSSRGSHHTRGFIIAVSCVALIHPTGAIYLGTMMIAHIIIGLSLRAEYSENLQKLLLACSILITIAAAISVVFLAPRMLDAAVFAEYGWQGGKPLLTYNALLLIFSLLAGWKLRKTVEGRLLISWIAMLWLLTAIHLIEGLQDIPVLSLLSYTLYSMGLHAFHIPLAALGALWLSPSTGLNSLDSKRGLLSINWDPTTNEKFAKVLTAVVLVAIIIANVITIQISQHDELRPITNGDLEIREAIENLPENSIIYTENNHWGYVYDLPNGIETTSIPSLGLLKIDETIHPLATSAIKYDNITKIKQLGIDYAISSPIGTIGWILAESRYWTIIEDFDGSRLWQFNQAGNSQQSTLAPVNESSCSENCEMRLDPWRENRYLYLGEMKQDYRAFIEEGENAVVDFDLSRTVFVNSNSCLFFESIGNIDDFTIKVGSQQSTITQTDSGWHTHCFNLNETMTQLTMEFSWHDSASSSTWVNPSGFSGRGDRIIDTTGIRLHWLEIDV